MDSHNFKALFHDRYKNHIFIKDNEYYNEYIINIICEKCKLKAKYLEPNCYINMSDSVEFLTCEEYIIKCIIE